MQIRSFRFCSFSIQWIQVVPLWLHYINIVIKLINYYSYILEINILKFPSCFTCSLVVRKNSETDLVATSCTAGSPSFEQKRMTGSVASLPASVGETTKNDHSKSFRKSNSNILKSPKSPKFSDSKAFKSPKLTDKHASKSPGEKKKKSPSWYNVSNMSFEVLIYS